MIVVAIVTAAVGAATALVYLPQWRKLQDIRSKIALEQCRMVEDAGMAAGVPGLVRQVQGMKKRYGNFDRRLPKRKELGGFLREISSHLSEESLSNQLIEPGSPQRAQLFHTLPIVLRFQGSYLSLASFLKRLDHMERLTQVEKLFVQHKGGTLPEEAGDNLEVEVQMNIYVTES
jgi:Tfp pilus assembly protein PilO